MPVCTVPSLTHTPCVAVYHFTHVWIDRPSFRGRSMVSTPLSPFRDPQVSRSAWILDCPWPRYIEVGTSKVKFLPPTWERSQLSRYAQYRLCHYPRLLRQGRLSKISNGYHCESGSEERWIWISRQSPSSCSIVQWQLTNDVGHLSVFVLVAQCLQR